MFEEQDVKFMKAALEQARAAFIEDEIPIGAVLVKDGKIIIGNHNRTRQLNNPLAHAESLIINEIMKKGEKYLNNYSLYVTVEPCLMCSGMIIWSRMGRVVFGCYDEKAGAVGSVYNTLLDKNFNHHPQVTSGILSKDCSKIIRDFFQNKRSD